MTNRKTAVKHPLIVAVEHLQSGDWEQAHTIAQDDETSLGCWAHGIVHMLEGDTDNARYWYQRARRPFPRHYDADAEIAALAAAVSSER